MIPLFNTDGTSTRPLGFAMNQNRLAVPIWSWAMEIYPPARIIELGSYNGGFTTALGVHAWNNACRIHSFDKMEAPDLAWRPLSKFLGIQFYQTDIFGEFARRMIAGLLASDGISYLLCDNGDKVREFNLFAPMTKPGDIVAAHDYRTEHWPWSEIHLDQIEKTVIECNLHSWNQEHFDLAGWLVYRKEMREGNLRLQPRNENQLEPGEEKVKVRID